MSDKEHLLRCTPIEVFAPTANFRWFLPKKTEWQKIPHSVLQQAWQGSLGSVEWKPIEWVAEE